MIPKNTIQMQIDYAAREDIIRRIRQTYDAPELSRATMGLYKDARIAGFLRHDTGLAHGREAAALVTKRAEILRLTFQLSADPKPLVPAEIMDALLKAVAKKHEMLSTPQDVMLGALAAVNDHAHKLKEGAYKYALQ